MISTNQSLDSIASLINNKIYVDATDPNIYIELLSIMPHPSTGIMPELAIVAAARTSFLGDSTSIDRDKKLFNYLYKHHHSSPSEMSEILFKIVGIDDIYIRELTQDQRWKVHSLRGDGTIIKIDLNNLISYLKYTEDSPLLDNPIKRFLYEIIPITYPWMAELLGLTPENEVSFLEKPKVKHYPMLDGFGDRWVEFHEIGCTDYDLGEMIDHLIIDARKLNLQSKIELMFESNDLRPLSMFSIKLALRAPVLVHWQLVRHRSINANFQSGRYMVFDEEDVYYPNSWRKQSVSNKQGSSDEVLNRRDFSEVILKLIQNPNPATRELANAAASKPWVNREDSVKINALLEEYYDTGHAIYKALLDQGAAKEQARMFLPAWASLYTAVIKFDLMYFMRFLRLRTAPDAQAEIRAYANQMFEIFKEAMPFTAEIAAQYNFSGS